MTDTRADGNYSGQDDDRLPWLESVEEEREHGPSIVRVVLLVLVGLVVISALVFGYLWFQGRGGVHGSGQLIQAPEGDYKTRPDDSGGMKVSGEGDARFLTSEGGSTSGMLDPGALPEQPVDGRTIARPDPAASNEGAKKVTANVPDESEAIAASAPKSSGGAPTAAAARAGSVVQLGSFPSDARADRAWKQFSKRFAYLAELQPSVERAEVGDATVYRLRIDTGSPARARDICGKLKIAGEACYVPAK